MESSLNVTKYDDRQARQVEDDFVEFLTDYVEGGAAEPRYLPEIKEFSKSERNTLLVNFADVYDFNKTLSDNIQTNFFRFYPNICRALHTVAMMQCRDDEVKKMKVRRKELYVSFHNTANKMRLRGLSSNVIGSLICISGQVVRTHQVHPELSKGGFSCSSCGVITRNIEQQFRYTQPARCSNPQCQNRSKFQLDVQESTFIDFQKIRIQEIQSELPRGSIPLSMDVIIRGELVETVQPGDRCDFVGALIVIPEVAQLSAPGMRAEMNNKNRGRMAADQEGITGLKTLGVRDLNYRIAFLACNLCASGSPYGKKLGELEENDPQVLWNALSSEERKEMQRMSHDRDIVTNLTNSLFPEIYGNQEVKLGVLLMLFGGVSKVCPNEGTKLRGDINICLVGDPSTAKSQILKTVEYFCPRAIYTSGKASSAAGLTAAVVKDEDSFEFVIEAGALMLADNGVCCIDEFDKMDSRDQVAIHEAMEQQTISITKAGVKATLNARASILAAANPVGGRYDRSRPLRHNIQLSAPIMSRFDLFFVLIDECNEVTDHAIARRIVDNHVNKSKRSDFPRVYTYDQIQKYITFSRCFKPKLSEKSRSLLVSEYKKLRLGDSNNSITSAWRITVRQLESLIRLSEALARIQCDEFVQESHVLEASRLLSNSLVRVDQPDIALQDDFKEIEDTTLPPGQILRQVLKSRNILAAKSQVPSNMLDIKTSAHRPIVQVDNNIKIRFDMYKKISDILVMRIRELEEQQSGNEDWEGVKQSELIEWYLNEMEDSFETVGEVELQHTVCKRVIRRLLTEDNILIQLNAENEEDPLLVVHPNHVISDE